MLGSGGHAKVVVATARAMGYTEIAVYDDDPARLDSEVLGVRIVGQTASVLGDPGALAVLAIGDNRTRLRLAASARCRFAVIVHPRSVVEETVVLGAGTVVFAGATIQPDTRIGAHGIVNTAASIDHDCSLGDAVHVAPGVHLAGTVTLGDGAFLGVGAVVTPNRRVGAWSVVGAGAVVVRDVPDNSVTYGVPARAR